MSIITFIILSLATWRLSSLFVNEAGPFEMFYHLRYKLGIRYDDHGQSYSTTEYGELFNCVWCFSIWAAVVIAVFWWIIPVYTTLACLPLALSAAAIGFDRYASD